MSNIWDQDNITPDGLNDDVVLDDDSIEKYARKARDMTNSALRDAKNIANRASKRAAEEGGKAAAEAGGEAAGAGGAAAGSAAAGGAEAVGAAGSAAASGAEAAVGAAEVAAEGAAEATAATGGTIWIAVAIIIGIIVIGLACFYIEDRFHPLQSISDAIEPRLAWFRDETRGFLDGVDEVTDDILDTARFLYGGIKDIMAIALDGDKYEQEPSDLWNGVTDPEKSEDVNKTQRILEAYKKHINDADLEESENAEDLDTTKETYWNEEMAKENNYLTNENKIDVLQRCVDYNNEMFRYFVQHYEYLQWKLEYVFDSFGQPNGKQWKPSWPNDDTKEDDLFELESRIHIEGEKKGTKRIFAVNWQDVMALLVLLTENKEAEEYKGYSEIVETDDPERLNHKLWVDEEKWAYNEEVEKVFKLFRYKFDYYYGTDDELDSHKTELTHYDYDKKPNPPFNKCLPNGDYQLGYRYKRIADPPTGVLPLDYSWEGEAPYTKFVPEQAPNMISNSWEAYKYIYIDIDEVPDYTPDPDVFEPPDGVYCIGRWHILNPKHFIESVSSINSYWQGLNTGKNGEIRRGYGYEWANELMQEYAEYLDVLPYTDAKTQGGQSRGEFFRELGQMYTKKQIRVTYEGTMYDEELMSEFISDLEEQYPGWHVVWDKDSESEFNENLGKKMKEKESSGGTGVGSGSSGVEVEGEETSLTEEEISAASDDVINLAKTIWDEARGEEYEGQIAIAQLVKNRMDSPSYPNTATEVVKQSGQFWGWGHKDLEHKSINSIPNAQHYINIAYNVLNGNLRLTNFEGVVGVLSAIGNSDPPSHHGGGDYYTRIGNQYFYSATQHHDTDISIDNTGYEEVVSADVGENGEKSNMTKGFYPPFDDPNTYPFWSYGVTFHSLHGYGDSFLHVADDEFAEVDEWLVDYDDVRLRSDEDLSAIERPDGFVGCDGYMDYYMNQATSDFSKEHRGGYKGTYASSGCSDCSVAMILSYWTGEKVNPLSFQNYVNSSNGKLDISGVLSNYGLKQSTSIAGNFISGVQGELKNGRPVLAHVKGHWEEYHTKSNGHFLTIYGYDDTGFYVGDPGKSANYRIPYESWTNISGDGSHELYYRTITRK